MANRPDLDELVIAPVTRRQLEAYLSSPVQALLLVGVAGGGVVLGSHCWGVSRSGGRK